MDTNYKTYMNKIIMGSFLEMISDLVTIVVTYAEQEPRSEKIISSECSSNTFSRARTRRQFMKNCVQGMDL